MLSALAGLVNVLGPIMTTQGGLLTQNTVQAIGGPASFDIFYTLAGPWIKAIGPLETELASLMNSLVAVLQALAT